MVVDCRKWGIRNRFGAQLMLVSSWIAGGRGNDRFKWFGRREDISTQCLQAGMNRSSSKRERFRDADAQDDQILSLPPARHPRPTAVARNAA